MPLRTQDELIKILHTLPSAEAAYDEAVLAWRADTPIWQSLTSRESRFEYVRYLVAQDATDRRPYESFPNRCTGFAAQLYARLSDRARLTLGATERLSTAAGVTIPPTTWKLRAPIFIVISGAHAYNAFLIGGEPKDFSSYLLYEPQNDDFIGTSHPEWARYVETFGVKFCDLVDFTEGRKFELQPRYCFIRGGLGEMKAVSSERVAALAHDFAIAETPKQNYDAYVRGSFSGFIRGRAALWKLSDTELHELGDLLAGRPLRTEVGGDADVLTKSGFFSLLGRPDLA